MNAVAAVSSSGDKCPIPDPSAAAPWLDSLIQANNDLLRIWVSFVPVSLSFLEWV